MCVCVCVCVCVILCSNSKAMRALLAINLPNEEKGHFE